MASERSGVRAGPVRAATLAALLMCFGAGVAAESSSALPVGSEYEKVTPAEKGDADLVYETSTIRSSVDGRRVTFQTPASYPGDRGSFIPNQGFGTLTPQGWTTQGIMPQVDPDWAGGSLDNRQGYQTFAEDLSGGAFVSPGPALTSDAAARLRNIYRTDFASGAYSLLTPAPITPFDPPAFRIFYSPVVAGATPDLGHVVYDTSGVELTPDAPVGVSSAYEWVGGTVRLVGILPDGTVAPGGAVPGRGAGGGFFGSTAFEQYQPGVISQDGSRIFFTTPGGMAGNGAAGTIYVRENGSRTRLVSVSKRTVPDPDGPQPATFLAASPDGRVVLFRSTEKLTDDSNANNGNVGGLKNEIYRYDIDADELTNLSAQMPDAEGLVGTDRSLTTVYFGGGNFNIYMWRDGVTRRVAAGVTVGGAADRNWPARLQITGKQSDVSPDGRYMVYWADRPQNGIDPGAAGQLFLYDAEADATTCLTCPQDDEPGGESALRPFQQGGAFIRPYLSRNFSSDSSHVFFETPQALVPGDANGKTDVYQYDLQNKQAELVSTGTGDSDAHFGDASADGSSVYFVTQQQVIPDLDDDRFSDLYVARAGASKHQSPPRQLPCVGDQCQGPLVPSPNDAVPGTVLFTDADDSGDDASHVDVFRVAPISSKQRRAWARTGRLRLSVLTSDGGRVNATVSGRLGKRTSVLARASKTSRGGGRVQLMLRLSKSSRQYLAKRGKLRVTIAVSYSGGGGPQRATLLLRHPSAPTTTRGAR